MLGEAAAAIVVRAQAEFAAARKIMAQQPRRVVKAPRIMGDAYRLILDRLVARGFSPPRAKVRLPRRKLLLIVLRNLV
jgi:phytoene/squalene synthetase